MTYMKKDAVSMRPTETMTTARVGYHSTGTGLEIALAACENITDGALVPREILEGLDHQRY